MSKKKKNRPGRPKNTPVLDTVVDEQSQARLDMSEEDSLVTVDDMTKKWKSFAVKLGEAAGESGISTVVAKWNKLNPFLQNQRIKNLYTTAKQYSKTDISTFLKDPGNSEEPLRSMAWANSSTQQIYYNILRRSMDIPQYKYFVIPEMLEKESDYSSDEFKSENRLVEDWLELFNIPNTFKTIAMEVKREGKSSYLLRNKFNKNNGKRSPAFTTLQKMPTQWVKITGKSQLGFTISFNMLYFLNIANSPSDFGEFMEQA